LFGLELQDALDLLCPGDNAAFKDVGFILFRAFRVEDFFVGEGQ
jgi:hypothetical protein